MNREALNQELLIQCQNVQCGAKLAAEVHYVYTKIGAGDILLIENTLSFWPDLKYLIRYTSVKKFADQGHKSVYIFKYKGVEPLIKAIEDIQESNPLLYHFASGKLFGYNDYEVMKFIEKL